MECKTLSKLLPIICFVIVACSGNLFVTPTVIPTSTPTILGIPSLKDKLSMLESSAHSVEKDSYLVGVHIKLDRQQSYTLAAWYHAASNSDKLILVKIDSSNKTDTQWVDIGVFKDEIQKPLSQKDWSIDSPEALSIFAKNNIVSSCLQSAEVAVEMSLDQVAKEFPVWELTLWGCPEKPQVKIYDLDARTGEVVIDPYK